MRAVGGHLAAWLAWWTVSFWLWLLLVGEWNRVEIVAAVCAATATATFAERVRSVSSHRLRIPLRRLTTLTTALAMVLVDFGILVHALARSLARREVVRGRFVARDFPTARTTPTGSGDRAWTTLVATYSPNAYVVDIDVEAQLVLLHDLVPFRRSEEPA